jgi:hypothetical protein
MPTERFMAAEKGHKEQVGHYYLKYGDKGLTLVRVTSGDGKSNLIYQAPFGKEEVLHELLNLLIANRKSTGGMTS